MSVYVDPLCEYGWVLRGRRTASCHMTADSDEELHALASKIGLKRSWHQPPPAHFSHYDLTPSRRAHAVAAGAVELTRAEPGPDGLRLCVSCRDAINDTARSREARP